MSGNKFDQEKVDLHVLDPFFIEGTARVAQFGEQKYGRSNWMQGLTQSRILNAIKRHIAQIEKGEDIDEESGFHHAYHAAWGCQVLAYQHRNDQTELDDRRWSASFRYSNYKSGSHEGIGGHTVPMLHDGPFGRLHAVPSEEDGLDLPVMQSEPTKEETKEDPISRSQKMIAAWADKVYPDRTPENALGKMMLHEIPELLTGGVDDPLEFADVAILLFDIAHLKGIDIGKAISDKMEINEGRVWEIDKVTGIMSHVKAENKFTEYAPNNPSSNPPDYPWEPFLPKWAEKASLSSPVVLQDLPSNAVVRIGHGRNLILIHKNVKSRSHLEKFYCAHIKDVDTEEEFAVSWNEIEPWKN